ncbi:hypothetical protein TSUD_128750 [Trifolium subterraneum]|uniref:Uncharacterized protein n=1 Tax=Trifolium subterraneum TaxID=3900 RepID=A0A2Z6MK08_TRISU|nr:hypothetical protein TSUD_128750 [Trifolium subterraneum]
MHLGQKNDVAPAAIVQETSPDSIVKTIALRSQIEQSLRLLMKLLQIKQMLKLIKKIRLNL